MGNDIIVLKLFMKIERDFSLTIAFYTLAEQNRIGKKQREAERELRLAKGTKLILKPKWKI